MFSIGVIRINTSFYNNSYYTKGFSDGYAKSESATVEYIYHTHDDSCIEECTVTFRVLSNDGQYCVYRYEYGNPKYPLYPAGNSIRNDYINFGGENYPKNYTCKYPSVYFCNKHTSVQSTNKDELLGQEDTGIIEGATIIFDT